MKKKDKTLFLYLLLIVMFWAFSFVTLKHLLLPYSVDFAKTGKMTFGYFLYAAIGILFSTPAPFFSMLILSLWYEKISLKEFLCEFFAPRTLKEPSF